MWLLAALSAASAAIILERALFFARYGRSRADELLPLLAGGRLDDARELVRSRRGLEAEVVRAALDAVDGGPANVAERVACTVRRQRPEYRRGLGFLGTLGSNVSPPASLGPLSTGITGPPAPSVHRGAGGCRPPGRTSGTLLVRPARRELAARVPPFRGVAHSEQGHGVDRPASNGGGRGPR